MDERGDEVHRSETEASGASRENVVRWVLIVGTVLAIILLSVIWMTGALNRDDTGDRYESVSDQQLQQTGTANDRGEPIAPAFGGSSAAASASPTAQATPGDAPAGDPTNDAK